MMIGRRRKRPFAALEKRLGYRFKQEALLEAALTHPSYRFEVRDVSADNQRLEFLGDAVLGFVVAAYLYRAMESLPEGRLTVLRSHLTRGKTLARLARELALGEFLRMGKGEAKSGGRERASNLEDAFEAVMGAVYLDGGIKAAQKVFDSVFARAADDLEDEVQATNPKGRLQEYAQRRWKVSPVYEELKREGPAHDTRFTVKAVLPDGTSATGNGRTKQDAERHAAAALLRTVPRADGAQ